MSWWDALILGIVEGLTEYLPVSSTGHLILAQRALDIPESPESNAYAICIQGGAIVAVLGLYWAHVRQMAQGWLGKLGIGRGNPSGFLMGLNILVAFLPAAGLGVLFDDKIEERLFGLWPVVGAWLVGGLAILAVSFWRRTHGGVAAGRSLSELTWKNAVVVGFIQCLAMWPGTSRSLVTIVGGVIVGLKLSAAVEFSFLLGVITLLAATVYKSLDVGPLMLSTYGWFPMLVGSVAAWISAVLAVKWMVGYLQRHGMEIFGYYRVILAIIVGGAIVAGWLKA